jgi:hypothetical protein
MVAQRFMLQTYEKLGRIVFYAYSKVGIFGDFFSNPMRNILLEFDT